MTEEDHIAKAVDRGPKHLLGQTWSADLTLPSGKSVPAVRLVLEFLPDVLSDAVEEEIKRMFEALTSDVAGVIL